MADGPERRIRRITRHQRLKVDSLTNPPDPDRCLRGAPNFRDLGGIVCGEGRRVRRARLFRSDHLGALQPEDFTQLRELEVGRVFDFRGVSERAAAACAYPDVTVHSLPIEPTIIQKLSDLVAAGNRLTAGDVVGLMQETYRGFVRQHTHHFAALFTHLLESDQPLVFHCTAGKDRTGFAAALILRALGAAHDDVMRDYLLTNGRLQPPPAAGRTLPPQAAAVLYRVQPDFLQAALEAVEQDYGSLEGYLREGLGLHEAQRQRLAALYLERPSGR